MKLRHSRIVPKESQRDTEWSNLQDLAFLPVERQGSQGEDVGAYAIAELTSAVPASLPVPLRTLRSYPFPVSLPAVPLKALFKAHTLQLLSPLKNLVNCFQHLEFQFLLELNIQFPHELNIPCTLNLWNQDYTWEELMVTHIYSKVFHV